MALYFVQPKGGGPIKVGAARCVRTRMAGLSGQSPHGLEMIASVPGHFYREALLLRLLRPFRAHGEWLASCPPVWRVLLEAVETGDISWLPTISDEELPSSASVIADGVKDHGSLDAVAKLVGFQVSNLTNYQSSPYAVRPRIYAAVRAYRMIRDGLVPDFISAGHALPQQAPAPPVPQGDEAGS